MPFLLVMATLAAFLEKTYLTRMRYIMVYLVFLSNVKAVLGQKGTQSYIQLINSYDVIKKLVSKYIVFKKNIVVW